MTAALLLAAALLAGGAAAPAAAAAAPSETERHLQLYRRDAWSDMPVGDIAEDPIKTRIVLHHTAELVSDAQKKLEGPSSWRAAVAHARRAQSFHKRIRGWKDIGYHYMIDWEGRIFEGRPVRLLGAHTERHNTGSVGVVLMGDMSRQRPTPKQVAALRELLAWLMEKYKLEPTAISGHYQDKRTICPGTYLNNLWDPSAEPVDFVQVAPRPKR